MKVNTAQTTDGSLLQALRDNLANADEALLAVAFVNEAGVHLLSKQLRQLGDKTRLLATTTFGTTTGAGLAMASSLGTQLRTLNPSGGTFHSKAFLTRRNNGDAALVIGSSNLTGGLLSNIEVATVVRGTMDDEAIAEAWTWAEDVWRHTKAKPWAKELAQAQGPTKFDERLHQLLQTATRENAKFLTLSHDKPNIVTALTPTGLYVETEASLLKGSQPQLVPSWMFELAWQTLQARGYVTQQAVLNELNIKRSAAVCAILARLPGVEVDQSGRGTVLRWIGT